MAAVVTVIEGVAAATAASVTGTACRMSRERRTDQPPHTFAGISYLILTKDENWVQGVLSGPDLNWVDFCLGFFYCLLLGLWGIWQLG